MKWTVCLVSMMLIASTAASLTHEENLRIARLEEALVAPCCYHEPVSRHQSEVAVEMRAEITRLVVEGKSDHEILGYYTSKFGKAILAEPRGLEGWVVQGIPFLMLLLGVGLVSRLVWKWRPEVQPPACQDGKSPGSERPAQDPIPEESRARIERELRDRHA